MDGEAESESDSMSESSNSSSISSSSSNYDSGDDASSESEIDDQLDLSHLNELDFLAEIDRLAAEKSEQGASGVAITNWKK